jgi:multisubunit Na+/H+ antiporter MnhE subunit
MRGRTPLFVLLASSLTFLASLFLPWRETQLPQGGGVYGLLNQFSGNGREFYGWLSGTGDVAVLLVVAIVLAVVVVLLRPQLGAKLPIGSLAVALAYFAVALALAIHAFSNVFVGFTGHPDRLAASWTYGFYLGLASAGIALLSGVAYRWSDRPRPRDPADSAACVLGIALLVSFLLPWVGVGGPEPESLAGIQNPPVAIAAVGLILGAGKVLREDGRRWRLPFALATAILVGGGASAFGSSYRYGTWIGIAGALLLVALEIVRALPLVLPAPPRGQTAVRLGAAALLIVALFLPWQEIRGSAAEGSFEGWSLISGAATGALCLLLLASPALRKFESYVLDAVAAIVVFVSALATSFRAESLIYRIGYGALIGVLAAGILFVSAFWHVRPGHVDRSRALVRAVPIALSVLCVAAAVIPSWFVLPETWRGQAEALSGWLAVAGVLIGLYLVRLWALRVRGPANTHGLLTLAPLVLLTLPSLELIRFRGDPEIQWGPIILVGLCLLLALCGWIEENRGLESFRVPEEIWRVDRLPEAES